ncbi:Hypothetical protein FKW44_022382 [Caligus rogercresseyi]|uniref:Uncharacterized protein n=1 Tax=Caligus rogercresseyi TaxID=217165 RepID=A0A7T8JVZ7_CALRO|nr:Hypothetical protein FKW44_022382 [Caligus rogercresseyi]
MLEGVEIVDKSVQKEWTRVGRTIPEDRFREAFRKWVESGRNVFESAEVMRKRFVKVVFVIIEIIFYDIFFPAYLSETAS